MKVTIGQVARKSVGKARGNTRQSVPVAEPTTPQYTIPDELETPEDAELCETFLAVCAVAIVKMQDGKAPWVKTYEIARSLNQEHSNFSHLETLREQGFLQISRKYFPASFAPTAMLPPRESRVKSHSAKDARTSAILRQLRVSTAPEQDERKVG